MTATELHQTDPDFQALIQCWIADKRCPIPMADYLRERGLEGQAEAVEWAAWKEDRPQFMADYKAGPYPNENGDGRYYWYFPASEEGSADAVRVANCLPNLLHRAVDLKRGSISECLLWLLDRWAEVAAQGIELPKAKVGVLC